MNESLRVEDRGHWISDTTCYNILARNGLVEAERRAMRCYKNFEWKHPDDLIQSDLTTFNGVPLLTMEDDHSRRGWAVSIEDEKDSTVADIIRAIVIAYLSEKGYLRGDESKR